MHSAVRTLEHGSPSPFLARDKVGAVGSSGPVRYNV
jgi:hypothetical protein